MNTFSTTDFLQSLLHHPESPMVFHSVLFMLLFSILYLVYVVVYKKTALRNILLLIFSLYFYYKISGIYVLALIFIASSDYFIGRLMFVRNSRTIKRNLMLLSLFINVGLLVCFKYTNFFLEMFFGVALGESSPIVFTLIAPIGISYFIFKTLSYILDIYHETTDRPEKNYINYLLYVSFFPNILSGPILRAGELLPQFKKQLSFSKGFISQAFLLIIIGAFKKIVIADYLAVNLVDRVFQSHAFFTSFEYLMAGYGYLLQLYFDFSGYTDMVIGIAMLLGFTSSPNFNKPFLAQNITEFWRRWHITLSTWLRDYIFSPLSIRFRYLGRAGLAAAVFITFIICGLWHDANYTYLVWGGLHGLIMAWEIITQKARLRLKKATNKRFYEIVSIFITFNVLMLSFIIFRAPDISVAADMLSHIFTDIDFSLAWQWIGLYKYPFIIIIVALLLHYTPMKWNIRLTALFGRLNWIWQSLIISLVIVFVYQFFSSDAQPFIYLNF